MVDYKLLKNGTWARVQKSGKLKFVSTSTAKRALGASRVNKARKGQILSTKSGKSRSRSSSSSKKSGSTGGRSMASRRPSITKLAALGIPVVAAIRNADKDVGFDNDLAGAIQDAMSEYVSYYTGFDIRDQTFSIMDAGIGWGPYVAAKFAGNIKQGLGNPSIPGPVTL